MKYKKIATIVTAVSIIAGSAVIGPNLLVHAEGINKVKETVNINKQMTDVVKAVDLKTGKVISVKNMSNPQSFDVKFHGYSHATEYDKYKLHQLKNQAYFHSEIQEKLYNYLLNSNNRWKIEKNAIQLHGGSRDNNCAYFVSTALNWVGANIPYLGYTGSIRNDLASQGWAKMTNIDQLRAGDICFSGNTHVYIFMGWANKDEGIAWIVDSQYGWFGNNAHVRSTWQDGEIDKLTDFWGGPTANVYNSNINMNENAGIDCKSYNVGRVDNWTEVYESPNYNNGTIGSFEDGELIQILGSANDFWEVNYNGNVGYVPKEEVVGSGPKYPDNITITNPEYTSKQYPEISTGTIDKYTWAMNTASWSNSHITNFDKGQTVTITGYEVGSGQEGGWYRVNYQDGSVWVPAKIVSTILKGKQYDTINNGLINNLGNNYTWIMSSNSWDGTHLGNLNNGTPINITGEDGDWYRIDYMQTSGWVPKDRVDNSANYSVKKLDETGIIDFSLGYTYAKNIPTWYGVKSYTLNNGTKVHITGEHEGWYRLDVNGAEEWVLKDRVKIYNILGSGTVTFPSYGGSCIWGGPSWSTNIIEVLNDGSNVSVIGEAGDWYKILTQSGQNAWIPKNRLITKLNKDILGTGITNMYTNVQENPSWSEGTLGAVNKGEAFNIVDEKDGWYKVDYNNGTGWIEGNRLDTSLNNNMKTQEIGFINFSGYTDLTYGPSWNCDLAGSLNNGSTVQIVGKDNGWTRINYKNTTAWVPSNRIETYKKIGEGTTNMYTNIQKNPSWSGGRLSVVNKGENLNIIAEKDGWYQVCYKNELGWIEGNRLNTALNKNMKKIKSGTVNFDNYTYVTFGPSWDCDVAGELKDGATIEIVGETNNWYRINYGKGTAWILKDRVDI